MFGHSATLITAERDWLAKAISLLSESPMEKIDLKKKYKAIYGAQVGEFIILDVPPLTYFAFDGAGDPNAAPEYTAAVEALYAASYTLKFMSKETLKRDYVVPPLEGLWWADDMADFTARRKDRWRRRMMILVPDFIGDAMAKGAITRARDKKKLPALSKLYLAHLEEGQVAQTLHIGSYDDEGPILKKLHDEFLPAKDLVEAGHHHEIYLSDPRKTPATKLKTILRQPVRSAI
jgi:hypothetical protein